jgi:hypothetical protein
MVAASAVGAVAAITAVVSGDSTVGLEPDDSNAS